MFFDVALDRLEMKDGCWSMFVCFGVDVAEVLDTMLTCRCTVVRERDTACRSAASTLDRHDCAQCPKACTPSIQLFIHAMACAVCDLSDKLLQRYEEEFWHEEEEGEDVIGIAKLCDNISEALVIHHALYAASSR